MIGYPPAVETARDLLLEQLGKLLTIEETLSRRMLPELKQEISDDQLKSVVSEHLEETRRHVERVRQAFDAMGASPSGRPADGLHGLDEERSSKAKDIAPSVRAGFNAAAAMGVEHYEINAYEAAMRLGDALGLGDVTGLLRATLDEEVAALGKLAAHADRLAQQGAEELDALPDKEYARLDDVGQELAPTEPKRPSPEQVPRPESGKPPGGPDYLEASPTPGAVRPSAPASNPPQGALQQQSKVRKRQQHVQEGDERQEAEKKAEEEAG